MSTQDLSDTEAELWAWEAFADAHPHEAYQTWPDRFWEYFHKRAPNVSRDQMVATLKETEETPDPRQARNA